MATSNSTFSNAGGAVSDLFGGIGQLFSADLNSESLELKAQGDFAESKQYGMAATLAQQNKQFTEASTAIQEAQQQRNTTMQIGGQEAAIAGAGFSNSGTALDILADSARQGALAKAVLGQQGQITEAGYKEQAESYTLMSNTAKEAGIEEQQMATEAEDAGIFGAIGSFAGAALKGAAAFAA